MKTMSAIFCGLSLLTATALQAQDNWTDKSPATKPSARDNHAMASIGSEQALLFGGVDAGLNRSDETWVYGLIDNVWTLQSPATKPLGRDLFAMAAIGGDQVLLFGGNKTPGILDDETWVYDLGDNTWTLKSPAAKPSARLAHAMVSIGGDQALLFGGGDTGDNDDETWVYDLSDNIWTLKNPATKPSARRFHAMAAIGGDQVLLFGGGFPPDDETWVYDVSDDAWTQKSPATKPSARRLFAMASIGGDQVLLFGGLDASGHDDETWVYDLSDNAWTLKSPATKPSARRAHAMASGGGGQGLLFGGVDAGGRDAETWVYTAVKPFVFLANKVTLKRTKQNTPVGDIHSNGALTIEKGDPSIYNSNLTAVGKITIQKDNTINGDVTSPIAISNSGTVNGTITVGPVATEPLPGKSYSGGVTNATVPSGGSLTLAPNSYNIVTLDGGGTLKLTSGDYFMNELRYPGSAAVIEIDLSSGDPVTINVVSNLQLGKEVEIRLLPNGEADSKLVTFFTLQSTAMSVGREAYFLGNLNAPNAIVTLLKNSQLRGAICANEIIIERDCLFLHHESSGSLPGPGNLPKTFGEDEEEVTSDQSPVTSYELQQNYPNPFNPSTGISFQLPVVSEVSLVIYNLNGQVVKSLVAGKLVAGQHEIMWDGRNEFGGRVASGVYVYRLKAGEFVAKRKLVLMK